ncbi:hypothetical protein FIBSPDRAFT_1055455 [Athelia psychrophila]|uniref:Isochorismatase-like domain-containing protein n=1 Tax=Athelia psychrophila TaxID=1759441 RepID=A0A167TNY9_9AGAM|nr:hypothetical protein FIBSPDRAFT_1055455 [Fibularhizoctonia sp. CBS 109695]
MSKLANTAVILIDPYSDISHLEKKLAHVLQLDRWGPRFTSQSARRRRSSNQIPIYYGLHQLSEGGHYDGFKRKHMGFTHPNPKANKISFVNADLDYQLKQRDIANIVLAGLILSFETCFESTARYAYELGRHVTMLKDAIAGIDPTAREAAARLVWPKIAQEATTVGAWVATLLE